VRKGRWEHSYLPVDSLTGWVRKKIDTKDTKRTFTSGLSEIVEGEDHLPERVRKKRDIESQGEVVVELFFKNGRALRKRDNGEGRAE